MSCKCGAEEIVQHDGGSTFGCGSFHGLTSEQVITPQCYERQIAKLIEENERLTRNVKLFEFFLKTPNKYASVMNDIGDFIEGKIEGDILTGKKYQNIPEDKVPEAKKMFADFVNGFTELTSLRAKGKRLDWWLEYGFEITKQWKSVTLDFDIDNNRHRIEAETFHQGVDRAMKEFPLTEPETPEETKPFGNPEGSYFQPK